MNNLMRIKDILFVVFLGLLFSLWEQGGIRIPEGFLSNVIKNFFMWGFPFYLGNSISGSSRGAGDSEAS